MPPWESGFANSRPFAISTEQLQPNVLHIRRNLLQLAQMDDVFMRGPLSKWTPTRSKRL